MMGEASESDVASQSHDTAFFSTVSVRTANDDTDIDDFIEDTVQTLVRPMHAFCSSSMSSSPTHTEMAEVGGEEERLGHAIKPLPNGMTTTTTMPFFSLSPPTTPTTELSGRSETSDYQSTPRPRSRPSALTLTHDIRQSYTNGDAETSPGISYSLYIQHNDARKSDAPRHLQTDVQAWGANFWYIVTDPSCSENTFFANPHTGECRWQVEAGTIVLPPNLHGEWWQLRDESTALPYFYHTQTGKTVWEKPSTGLVIPLLAVQQTVSEKQRQATSSTSSRASLSSECGSETHGQVVVGSRTQRIIRFSESSSASISVAAQTAARGPSLTVEQLLTGRARCSILDRDRQFVAQALASSPLPHSLPPRRTHTVSANLTVPNRPSIHFEGNRILSSSKTLTEEQRPDVLLPKSTSLGNLRAYIPNRGVATRDTQPVTALSFSQSYDTRRLTVRRQRDPTKRTALNSATAAPASHTLQPDARQFPAASHRSSYTDSWRPASFDTPLALVGAEYVEFAARTFAVQRSGSFPFRRKSTVSELLKWQKSSLSAPLFPLQDRHAHREGIILFRVLQKIMGDRDGVVLNHLHRGNRSRSLSLFGVTHRKQNTSESSSQSSKGGARDQRRVDTSTFSSSSSSTTSSGAVTNVGLQQEQKWMLQRAAQSPALRDEMYAQTLKQLTANPSLISFERGKHWLALLLSHTPPSPSDKMHPHVHRFLQQIDASFDTAEQGHQDG